MSSTSEQAPPAPDHGAIRSFAQWLRSLDESRLAALLDHRRDLAQPTPRSLADLAARASIEVSLARAVERLDAWLRAAVVALAAAEEPTPRAAAWLLEVGPDEAVPAVDALVERGLAWYPSGRSGVDEPAELLRGVRSHLGPYPGGLAPPGTRPLTEDEVRQRWAEVGDAERETADRLVWNQPTGAVRNADQRGNGDTPIDRLLAVGLLRPLGSDRVILPREVALFRRAPRRLLAEPATAGPPLAGSGTRPVAGVDRAAVGTAFELVGDVEEAAERLAAEPRRLLRDGSVSQRDLATLARALGTSPARAAWVVEIAAAGGLVRRSVDLTLLPTLAYDHWLDLSPAQRWAELVGGWRSAERRFGHDGTVHALSPAAEWRGAPDLRGVLARILTDRGAGGRVDQTALAAAIAWHRPALARTARYVELVTEAWHDLAGLGLSGLDCVTSAGGAWAGDELVGALGSLFPETVHDIVIQSDLTAVAAGPLVADTAAALRLLAEAESRGAATVFRFDAASIRRAFDAGWSAEQVEDWLTDHAPAGVPQPLRYLIGDVARRYGSVRIGAASAYIRTGDEAHAAAVLRHPDAATLGIRRLGPGILVAQAEPYEVAELLRAMRLSPAVEDAEGQIRVSPPSRRAGPHAGQEPVTPRPVQPDPVDTARRVLAAERSQERLSKETGSVLQVLEVAHRDHARVTVSYVANDGTPQTRTVVPLSLSAGQVRLLDDGQRFTLSLGRISSAGWPEDTA